MNHHKVITDIINKYSDFPKTQADMRKLLGYAESQFRMFLTPIIKDTTPEPRSIGAILASYPALLRKEMLLVIDSVLELAAAAARNSIKELPDTGGGLTRAELIAKLTDKHYAAFRTVHGDKLPATLRDDLEFIVKQIVNKVSAVVVETVDELLSAKKEATNA